MTPREELEARITALLLGELPAEEAASLRQTIAQDAELARLHDRLKLAIELVRETIASPSQAETAPPDVVKLSAERREKLMATFQAKRQDQFQQRQRRRLMRREFLAVAAMFVGLLLVAAVLLKRQWTGVTMAKGASDDSLFDHYAQNLGFVKARAEELQVLGGHGVASSSTLGEDGDRFGVSDTITAQTPQVVHESEKSVADFKDNKGYSGRADMDVASTAPLVNLEVKSQSAPRAGNRIALPQQDAQVVDGTSDLTQREGFFADEAVIAEDRDLNKWGTKQFAGGGGGAGGGFGGAAGNGPKLPRESAYWYDKLAGNAEQSSVAATDLTPVPASFGGSPNSTDTSSRFEARYSGKSAPVTDLGVEVTDRDRAVRSANLPSIYEAARVSPVAGVPVPAFNPPPPPPPLDPATGLSAPTPATSPNIELSLTRGNMVVVNNGSVTRMEDDGLKGLGRVALDYTTVPQASLPPLEALVAARLSDNLLTAEPVPTAPIDEKRKAVELQSSTSLPRGRLFLEEDRGKGLAKSAEFRSTNSFFFGNYASEAVPGAAPMLGVRYPAIDQNDAFGEKPKDAPAAVKADFYSHQTVEFFETEARVSTKREESDSDAKMARKNQVANDDRAKVYSVQALGYLNGNDKGVADGRKLNPTPPQPSPMSSLVAGKPIERLGRLEKELNPEQLDKPLPKLAAGAAVPQPDVSTAENAFSTFSLNVSDVSFKLAAASLEKGQMPDPATVRSEEFINAFDYHDCEPAGSAPIAFAWERARYPFAHDRDLLRFSVKTAASGRQPGRPLNVVLLLDNSGSMERADRVRIRQECLRVLAGQLQPQDRVSVVAFARTARLWVDGLPGSQAGELSQRVGGLTPEGGTNLEEAMNLAYKTALRHFLAHGVNRVVLLTDGAANLGDVQPESLKKKVEANRQQGIALDCFGIGWDGLNDELLEALSRNGDGRYGFVNTPEAATTEFAAQLAGALKVAASDVKVQVEWNPRRVTAYRQIGYAKHQLKKEQFRDNTVDAAELGAAEAGNALYAVQVNPAGEGPLGTVRVRFKAPGTSDYREHEWPLPYEGGAKSLDQSSTALRLAASASAFSEWLVSSPFAAEVTPDKLLGYLSGVPESFSADPRPKKLEWMIRQARSVAGK